MADKKLILRCQYKDGQKKTISSLSIASTVQELQEEIFILTDIAPARQRVLHGFPPTEIMICDIRASLASVGIKHGDSLIIEESRLKPLVPSTRRSQLVRKVVPADNSCLFTSLSFVLLNGETSFAGDLRQCAANCIAADPGTYNDVVLNTKNEAYCQWLLNPQHWGGAIEIGALSNFYQVEVDVADIMSGRLDRYGELERYPNRVFLLYDGIHYDPLFREDPIRPGVFLQAVFPTSDDTLIAEALSIADDAKKKRQYTDLSGFSLRCLVCSAPLTGQAQAQSHAMQTGHSNFGEV